MTRWWTGIVLTATFVVALSVNIDAVAARASTPTAGMPFPICTAAGAQESPAISGHTVVWADHRNGQSDIYGYDLVSGREFPICTAAGGQGSPAIFGHTVVWEDRRSGHPDIYGYDLVSGREFPVCTAAGGQTSPSISGHTVVWKDHRHGHWDIYGRDLVSKRSFLVARVSKRDMLWLAYPVVSGSTVVWVDGSGRVWGCGVHARKTFLIWGATRGRLATVAVISHGTVVWGEYSESTNDPGRIRGLHLRSGSRFTVLVGAAGVPALSGNLLVSAYYRGGLVIYGCDLAGGRKFPICTDPVDLVQPAISGDTVVWAAVSSGSDSDIHGCYLHR
jgi:beta propeller repeat protein